MFNGSLSKYYISDAKYEDSNTCLIEFDIHSDTGANIGPAIKKNRLWVLSKLIQGTSFYTITIHSDNSWEKRNKIIINITNGGMYIKTEPDTCPCDSLIF